MTRFDGSVDVVVVGAGVIGCAVAHALAPDADVLVLDRDNVASQTTAKASGLITTIPDVPRFPDAARHAMQFFEAFDGTGDFSLTERSSVHLVTADEETSALEQTRTFASHGFDVRYRTATDLADRYPDVFELGDFVGGIEYAETGWIDPYTYAMALKKAAEARGATFTTGVDVRSVLGDDTVTGVDADGETVRADRVVCATNWRTRSLLREHVEVPVRPFRWQTVNLEVSRELGDAFPMGWDRESGFYWRPEHNGDLHVGGGTYFVDDPGSRRESVTSEFRDRISRLLPDRLQGVEDARIVTDDCCPTGDAATPDDHPIVAEPEAGPAGLIIATAGSVGGIMCSPIVARAVEELVTGDPAPFPVDPFRLDRFADRSTDFTCDYVSNRG